MADGGFHLTVSQTAAQEVLASAARYIILYGGSRSGKTFLLVRSVVLRALKAPNSRHAVFRFRLAHIKASVWSQTFPDVMRKCFPGVDYDMNRGELYVTLQNGSEIWFGGLDDKDRTEKILGMEFVTVYFNECSQIPWASIQLALTRLAQRIEQSVQGLGMLVARAYFDCNPPNKAHWTYQLFIKKIDPDTREAIRNPELYDALKMNPQDNAENLEGSYLDALKNMGPRMRKRFWEGEFADANPDALFPEECIDMNRLADGEPPDMVRIVVAVDPSGAGDTDNAGNDAIGIVVAGLGTDGKGYVMEDLTVKAGPKTWGRIAVEAYIRYRASTIVYETNFGGAMVEMVIRQAAKELAVKVAARPVSASRGKVVRAEPISQLYEENKIVHVGYFSELEEELSNFTTHGFVGSRSPNRADALVWALTALWPSVGRPKREFQGPRIAPKIGPSSLHAGLSWMGH